MRELNLAAGVDALDRSRHLGEGGSLPDVGPEGELDHHGAAVDEFESAAHQDAPQCFPHLGLGGDPTPVSGALHAEGISPPAEDGKFHVAHLSLLGSYATGCRVNSSLR